MSRERYMLLSGAETKRVLSGVSNELRLVMLDNGFEYVIGDVLCIKEPYKIGQDGEVIYLNDLEGDEWTSLLYTDLAYKPGVLMDKSLVRLKLRITDVRSEFLQDIIHYRGWYAYGLMSKEEFIRYWNESCGRSVKRKGWSANPAVYVITFDRI